MAKTAEYNLGSFTFPRGWFLIAKAEAATNKPVPLRYFGRDLIMYRGASGKVAVMDAYCPHMKTHLAKNTTSYVVIDGNQIDGDDIRCPYHGWKFGPDGVCNEIPYSPAPIPKAAKIRSYPAREWCGFIAMWFDEEQNDPNFEPPAMPQWESPKWINWIIDDLGIIDCHPEEVVDNIADKAHLGPIHGTQNIEHFDNVFEDHVMRQSTAAGNVKMPGVVFANETFYTGPGILLSRMTGMMDSYMLVAHTPVEDGSVQAWHGLIAEAQNNPPTDQDQQMVAMFQVFSKEALLQDFEVWAHKEPCFQIMKVLGDGPFGKTRTWYKQFYNPVSEADKYQNAVNGKVITKGTKRDHWPDKVKEPAE